MANPRTNKPPVRKKRSRAASTAEINTNTAKSTHWLTVGVLAIYVFSSIISFFGLNAVGLWFLPAGWSAALIGMVDLSIGVYKFAEIKLRQDDRKVHLAKKAKAAVVLGTVLSCIGNVIHIIVLADPDPLKFYGSMLFAGASPWLLYLAASVLTDILVKPKPKKVAPVKVPAQRRARKTEKLSDMVQNEDKGWLPLTDPPKQEIPPMPPPVKTFTVDKKTEPEVMQRW